MAYCTDIRVISIFFNVYSMPRPGIEPVLTASQKRYGLSYAAPWVIICLKTYINLIMCLTM